MKLTTEQIDALAPDAAAIAAGLKIGSSTWALLGASERALWGEFAGSGKKPYQVVFDQRSNGYKCSCPSRKFPCKHTLGLMYADANGKIADDAEPDWVAEWLDARDARAEKAKAKAEAEKSGDKPKKTTKSGKTSSKAAEKRAERVAEGMEQLKTWLSDLIRVGLGSLDAKTKVFAEQSKRLIDAQAPGVAAMVQRCGKCIEQSPNWHEQLLGQLGSLALLVEAYGKIDKAPEDFASELRQTISWTISQADLLETGERVEDQWISIGQIIDASERVRAKRSWFWGAKSNRYALFLQFAAGRQAGFQEDFPEGFARVETAARFYPGVMKTRALWEPVDSADAQPQSVGLPKNLAVSIPDLIKRHGEALQKYPWTPFVPILLADVFVRPTPDEDLKKIGSEWRLVDKTGNVLPVKFDVDFERKWTVVAVSAEELIDVFGEWDGQFFSPISMWIDGACVYSISR